MAQKPPRARTLDGGYRPLREGGRVPARDEPLDGEVPKGDAMDGVIEVIGGWPIK